MKIALYGMPCAGKTTMLSKVKNAKIINGSDTLNSMANGSFKNLSEAEKNELRIKYIEYLKTLKEELVISDGHYSFLNKVVFTEHDAQAYDAFIYLYCDPKALKERYALSEKNEAFARLSIKKIEKWQAFEIEGLRAECHKNEKDFYVIGKEATENDFEELLEAILNGYSPYAHAKEIVKKITAKFNSPCKISLVDGDKTLIVQDSFRVCSNGCKTKVFDGNFYTGYQSIAFAKELNGFDYNYDLISQIELNKEIFEMIKNEPYFVISAGDTRLWKRLGERFGLENVIANPLISADTKYFVAKLLKKAGYTITAFGDCKTDIYMLREANTGFLCIGEKLSRSLINESTKGLRLIYNKEMVVLSEIYKQELENDIAVCKSDSGINGNELAAAHYSLGQKMGKEIGKIIPKNDTLLLALERGGRFFADGLYLSFGGTLQPYNPSCQDLPQIDSSTIVIVDSVINTGKSLLGLIEKVKVMSPNIEIIIATNVICQRAIPLFSDYKLYAVRVSNNSFVGKNQAEQKGDTGPDTADRLFNLIK